MISNPLPLVFFGLLGIGLIGVCVWPELDLVVSGWFYKPGEGFYLADNPVLIFIHALAVKGAWILGAGLILLLGGSYVQQSRKERSYLTPKAWWFLVLALLLGPVLIANVGLKDHWGRARPREIVEFGGTAAFTPALVPQPASHKNGSFISGDGAFGFYLPCFAFVVPLSRRKLSRRVFWGGIGMGSLFAFDRIAMGGHFLSDNLFAALLMLVKSALLHAAMYGGKSTRDYWRSWI